MSIADSIVSGKDSIKQALAGNILVNGFFEFGAGNGPHTSNGRYFDDTWAFVARGGTMIRTNAEDRSSVNVVASASEHATLAQSILGSSPTMSTEASLTFAVDVRVRRRSRVRNYLSNTNTGGPYSGYFTIGTKTYYLSDHVFSADQWVRAVFHVPREVASNKFISMHVCPGASIDFSNAVLLSGQFYTAPLIPPTFTAIATAFPGTGAFNGYVHIVPEGSASGTWEIFHGLSSTDFVVNTWDLSGAFFFADTIEAVDNNQLDITFIPDQDGKAVILSAGGTSPSYVHTQTTPNATWNVNHSLSSDALLFLVWDATGSTLLPGSLVQNDLDNVTVTFGSSQTGKLVILQGTSFDGDDTSSWTITHSLNSEHLVVCVYDESDEWLVPEEVSVLDANNIHVTFSGAQSGRIVVAAYTE